MRVLLFALLLTACRMPCTTTCGRPLPPIPASVPSVLGPVPVVWFDSLPSDQPGFVTLGRFNPLDRRIEMWRRIQGRGEQWRILEHESCHLAHWDSGLRYVNDDIERICDAWAKERVARLLNR